MFEIWCNSEICISVLQVLLHIPMLTMAVVVDHIILIKSTAVEVKPPFLVVV